jgi:hypothetical protein
LLSNKFCFIYFSVISKTFSPHFCVFLPNTSHCFHSFSYQYSRSQCASGLRHELFSPAPTLRSWVRILLKHGCLCVFCVRFFCVYVVSSETASRPNKG